MPTIATWNLENLYRPGGQFGPKTADAYDTKLTTLAATIRAADLDVLAVQEIGDPDALNDLIDRLPGRWHRAVSDHPDTRGIRVAFISRTTIDSTHEVVEFPDDLAPLQASDDGAVTKRMGRGALHITTGGIGYVTVHLKSKLITYPGGRFTPSDEGERARYAAYALYRRAAEAATLRSYANAALDGRGAERRLVVLGDLNDEPNAATTQILLGPGGSEIGTPGELTPDNGDGSRLWNLASRLAAGSYTRKYRGRGEIIDHILVSRALLAHATDVRTVHSGDLPSVTDNPSGRRDSPGSDHALVVATIA